MDANHTSRKILPVKEPILTPYADTANLQAIVFNCEHSYEWFYNHFIQLYGFNRTQDRYILIRFRDLRFDDCVFTKDYFQNINRDFILSKWGSIHTFLIDTLNLDYYIKIFVDKYYLPEAPYYYKKTHLGHDIFIYGYDKEKELFYYTDFMGYNKYGFTEISFSNIQDAVMHLDINMLAKGMMKIWFTEILLIKITEKEFCFNINDFKVLLKDYYYSRNTIDDYYTRERLKEENVVYGLSVYDVLLDFIDSVVKSEYDIDFKTFHTLYNHKQSMSMKINYLIDKGLLKNAHDIYENWKLIEKAALNNRNLLIKYSVSKKEGLVSRVLDGIEMMRNKEKVIIEDILSQLDS